MPASEKPPPIGEMSHGPRIAAIVGVTAAGKSALGEALAERLGGEVVCADSRQVFRELEIGTGKPRPDERAARPHHLFDALSLSPSHTPGRASAGWYARAAASVCAAIHARSRVPVLVGGSGLYLKALQTGLSGEPPHAPEIRARLKRELEAGGPEALHRRLLELDPVTGARLEPRESQRITRALEVYEASGLPLSWWHGRPPRAPIEAEWRTLEITVVPRALAERIARRTRAMFEGGLVDEVRELVGAGLREPLRRLRAVGYDEALDLIEGRISRAEAEQRTNTRTRQLAKRQRTWFRHQVETVQIDGETPSAADLLRAAVEALHG
jgi:tRNA dimethylallyltransferase